MTNVPLLRQVSPDAIAGLARPPVSPSTLSAAGEIVGAVRQRGEAAVREFAERFGERARGEPLLLGRAEMRAALDALDPADRATLERVAGRIESFARAQRDSVRELSVAVPGGRAGHTIEPVASAGCYAPAGRYPLPSSVLMTAITARVAGCRRVVVASPRAHPITLAAAAVAGTDEFLAVGGAHAIAALAYGFHGDERLDRCDVIAGPGNAWVTAAKQLVSGVVGIDMLAGPSELLIIADETADAGLVAADLLAQAEHDADASAMLVTTSQSLANDVERELVRQLALLPTRDVAALGLKNGFVAVVDTEDEMAAVADRIAAEHLEVMTADPEGLATRISNAGAVFLGSASAEVLGDYGAGPNHTLPTGGTARFQAGLSVMHFLRLRTWLRIDDTAESSSLRADTQRLAAMEGLAGHAEAARRRDLFGG